MGNGTVRTSGLTPHYIHDVFILGLGQTMARRICDILDVVDAQSSAGVIGSRDNPSTADGTRNAIHQQWNRDSLLGRSYRDVREVVAANTLPSYHALTSIPSSNSRDNTLSRELHHFTVRSTYLSSSTKIFCINFPLCEMIKL